MPDAQRQRHYIRSSSFVMAALFTVLCGAAALCLGYFINFFAKDHLVHSTEAVLDSQIALVKMSDMPQEGIQGDYLYHFLDEKGRLPDTVAGDVSRFSEGIIVFDYAGDQRRYAAKIYSAADGEKLLIGFDITRISNDFRLMHIMGICSIIFVMIVVFVSYLISVFVVSGTNKIADTAQHIIKTGDLSQRLDVPSRWDDLSNMAGVLNDLLARIEALMIGVRRVSDNIAHDLRTPLTRMRNRIETLQEKYNDEDHAALLHDADHMLRTFTALLRISRLETEQQRSHFQDVNLKTILQDMITLYEPLAEEKGIRIDHDIADVTVKGDKDMLFQAFANLLDNAIKYTGQHTSGGGHISLTAAMQNGRIRVRVQDNGPGVDDDELDKIFDRFYRAEKSRTTDGTGLGLSLVKAVIELHHGSVYAEKSDQGLRIITIL